MSIGEKEMSKSFNIYYLNFSKVYEISMMINNVIISGIHRENSSTFEQYDKNSASISTELGSKTYLASVKSVIGSESGVHSLNSSKMIESLDVKTTKSILLREILSKCKKVENFEKCIEGDLIKIDDISLRILNEETLRQFLMLRRDALKGFQVEGFEINNLISSMLQDYSYIIYGKANESDEEIIFKIPMEIENEFESKYNVYDLLIGHVSIIGLYKGTVTENYIKTSTFDYFMNSVTPQQSSEKKVFPSVVSEQHTKPIIREERSVDQEERKFHFIDIIAIVQDVSFKKEEKSAVLKQSWYKKLLKFLRLGGKKK